MSQTSKHFTPAQKAEIVRRHLSGKEPMSNLADKFGDQPSQIHNWVKQVLEQAERAFQVGPRRLVPPRQRQGSQDRATLKLECVRPAALSSLEEAQSRILSYVNHYNNCRLQSLIDRVTSANKLAGLNGVIFAKYSRKLEEAQDR
jgi:transposase-like protein